jgi:hypothetical protein
LTPAENRELRRRAKVAGTDVSAYVRWRVFGFVPVKAESEETQR